MKSINFDKSMALWKKAVQLIPNQTQCFSKGPSQFSFGVCPVYLKSGNGVKIIDVDDNEYIDFGMGLHSVVLGYSHPKVTAAINNAVQKGINLTLTHPLEVEVAEMLKNLIPCAEMVRFTKTGSEATSAAVKIARAVTGKEHIATCGYHGWHDWFIGATEKDTGIPAAIKSMVHKFNYNDINSLKNLFTETENNIAAVIMEPCGVIPPEGDFLERCKRTAHDNGALFIFDEIITGFRWGKKGAQSFFNVIPDIALFGKAMANGMPLAAVTGKREYMEALEKKNVFLSTTFGGEIASLAACKATLEVIEKENVTEFISVQGKKLMDGLNRLIGGNGLVDFMEITGFPCRPVAVFKKTNGSDPMAIKSYIQQECALRGLLFTGYFAVSLAHTDEVIEKSLSIFSDVLKILTERIKQHDMLDHLKGEVVSPVFRNL